MTDAEIDALAREILSYSIQEVLGWDSDFFYQVLRLPDGELIPVYGATSQQGLGSVLCELMPLAAIKAVIVESEKIYDEFVISLETKENLSDHNKRILKETYLKGRDRSIRLMARTASLHLIAFFHLQLADTIDEAVEDCKVMAEGFVALTFAEVLDPYAPEPVKIDVRKAIDHAAERVAAKKRKFLLDSIKNLPYMITHRGRGAPRKSSYAREVARQEYAVKVEAAYRMLRSKKEKPPTKTSVAKELGEGGLNPKTGIDSSLSAFRNKLKRLAINYDEITEKVEAELNNNS